MGVTLLAVSSVALIPHEVPGLDVALGEVKDLLHQHLIWLGLAAFLRVVGGIDRPWAQTGCRRVPACAWWPWLAWSSVKIW